MKILSETDLCPKDLAESDLVYTETLIRRGRIDYADKKVLILGAGDGALLWELLKEKPRMVTMIEVEPQMERPNLTM